MRTKRTVAGKIAFGLGILICVILIPILVVNITMIIKSYTAPEKVPDFLGYKPFIVLSGSMEPTIMTGDIVVTETVTPESVQVDDIIAYRDDEDVVVTHRVIAVETTDGALQFSTKGDYNNNADPNLIDATALEGKYIFKIDGMGNFAMFIQTPIGLLVFVITPLLLFILWDFFTRSRKGKNRSKREEELLAELERLKAEKESNSSATEKSEAAEENAAEAAGTAEVDAAVDSKE